MFQGEVSLCDMIFNSTIFHCHSIVSKIIIASLEIFVIFRDIAGVIYVCFINFQSFEITTL